MAKAKPSDLSAEAASGFIGEMGNPFIYSSPSFYAFELGKYFKESGIVSRPASPVDVRMGRGDSIRGNGMRFEFKPLYVGGAVIGIKFNRVE